MTDKKTQKLNKIVDENVIEISQKIIALTMNNLDILFKDINTLKNKNDQLVNDVLPSLADLTDCLTSLAGAFIAADVKLRKIKIN